MMLGLSKYPIIVGYMDVKIEPTAGVVHGDADTAFLNRIESEENLSILGDVFLSYP